MKYPRTQASFLVFLEIHNFNISISKSESISDIYLIYFALKMHNVKWLETLNQFHPKPSPPWSRFEGGKPSPHPPKDNHCVQNPCPSEKNGESKTPPPGHKVRKFHKCIYKLFQTLFEMKSFNVSTNKTVFQ